MNAFTPDPRVLPDRLLRLTCCDCGGLPKSYPGLMGWMPVCECLEEPEEDPEDLEPDAAYLRKWESRWSV